MITMMLLPMVVMMMMVVVVVAVVVVVVMMMMVVVVVVVVVMVVVAVMMIINLQTGDKPRLYYCAACALSCVVMVRFGVCRLFGTTGYCAACNKMIPAFEMVMRARGNVYHLECFACQQCSHRLVSVCIQPHTFTPPPPPPHSLFTGLLLEKIHLFLKERCP